MDGVGEWDTDVKIGVDIFYACVDTLAIKISNKN